MKRAHVSKPQERSKKQKTADRLKAAETGVHFLNNNEPAILYGVDKNVLGARLRLSLNPERNDTDTQGNNYVGAHTEQQQRARQHECSVACIKPNIAFDEKNIDDKRKWVAKLRRQTHLPFLQERAEYLLVEWLGKYSKEEKFGQGDRYLVCLLDRGNVETNSYCRFKVADMNKDLSLSEYFNAFEPSDSNDKATLNLEFWVQEAPPEKPGVVEEASKRMRTIGNGSQFVLFPQLDIKVSRDYKQEGSDSETPGTTSANMSLGTQPAILRRMKLSKFHPAELLSLLRTLICYGSRCAEDEQLLYGVMTALAERHGPVSLAPGREFRTGIQLLAQHLALFLTDHTACEPRQVLEFLGYALLAEHDPNWSLPEQLLRAWKKVVWTASKCVDTWRMPQEISSSKKPVVMATWEVSQNLAKHFWGSGKESDLFALALGARGRRRQYDATPPPQAAMPRSYFLDTFCRPNLVLLLPPSEVETLYDFRQPLHTLHAVMQQVNKAVTGFNYRRDRARPELARFARAVRDAQEVALAAMLPEEKTLVAFETRNNATVPFPSAYLSLLFGAHTYELEGTLGAPQTIMLDPRNPTDLPKVFNLVDGLRLPSEKETAQLITGFWNDLTSTGPTDAGFSLQNQRQTKRQAMISNGVACNGHVAALDGQAMNLQRGEEGELLLDGTAYSARLTRNIILPETETKLKSRFEALLQQHVSSVATARQLLRNTSSVVLLPVLTPEGGCESQLLGPGLVGAVDLLLRINVLLHGTLWRLSRELTQLEVLNAELHVWVCLQLDDFWKKQQRALTAAAGESTSWVHNDTAKRKVRLHQEKALQSLGQTPERAALLGPTGSGKTLVAMEHMRRVLESAAHPPKYVLFVTRASAFCSAQAEIQCFTDRVMRVSAAESPDNNEEKASESATDGETKAIEVGQTPWEQYVALVDVKDTLGSVMHRLEPLAGEAMIIMDGLHLIPAECTQPLLRLASAAQFLLLIANTPVARHQLDHLLPLFRHASLFPLQPSEKQNLVMALSSAVVCRFETKVKVEHKKHVIEFTEEEAERDRAALGDGNVEQRNKKRMTVAYEAVIRGMVRRIIIANQQGKAVYVVACDPAFQAKLKEAVQKEATDRRRGRVNLVEVSEHAGVYFTPKKAATGVRVIIGTCDLVEGLVLTGCSVIITTVYPGKEAELEQLEASMSGLGQAAKNVTVEKVLAGILQDLDKKTTTVESVQELLARCNIRTLE